MSKVVRFPEPEHPPKPLSELVGLAQNLAKDTSKISWDNPHVQLRMRERKVSIRQILDVLRNGKGIDGPKLDKYGDWRIKMSRYTAGRKVQVVIVVKHDHLEVVTVI